MIAAILNIEAIKSPQYLRLLKKCPKNMPYAIFRIVFVITQNEARKQLIMD